MVGWGMRVQPWWVARVKQINRPVTVEVWSATVWVDEYGTRRYSANIRHCPHDLAFQQCRGTGPVLVWGGGLLPRLQMLLGRVSTKTE